MTKAELRNSFKQQRLALSQAQRSRLEDLMLIQFQQHEFEIPDCIMTYAPIERMAEPDPQLITDYCFFKNPCQRLFYPVINTEGEGMHCAQVNDDTYFEKTKLGIDEPVDAILSIADELDMIIVPLLAFDVKGNRVGYGAGYYDRFLKTCRDDVLKIGFSFFDAVPHISDVSRYDVKLDYCFTPHRTYRF